jgi:hypothetical protein
MNAPDVVATDLLDHQRHTTSDHGRRQLGVDRALFGVQSLVVCLLIVASALDLSAQSASTGALTGTVMNHPGFVGEPLV